MTYYVDPETFILKISAFGVENYKIIISQYCGIYYEVILSVMCHHPSCQRTLVWIGFLVCLEPT